MVPLPPPPDVPRREAISRPAPRTVAAPFADAPHWPRPGQLTAGWRWVLLTGWVAILLGLVAIGGAGDVLGKRSWWLAGALVVVPFVLPGLAAFGALRNTSWALWAATAAIVSLAVTAVLDIADAPGAAGATAVLALIGILTTGSSAAGRMPRMRPPAGEA